MNVGWAHLVFWTAVGIMAGGQIVFAYLDRVFRELGRVSTGRIHANLDVFEAEVEPRLKMDRRGASMSFSLLTHLWFALTAVQVARGVIHFVPGQWSGWLELTVGLTSQVLLGIYLIPSFLLARTTGRWLIPLAPVLRVFCWLVWPLRAMLEGAVSLALLGEPRSSGAQATQEGIEQLVEAAQEEGILKTEQAELIEQVVEFTDKRVRDVMIPRPDIVAIAASASLEDMRRLCVSTKFSRIPVYDGSLDDIIGIAFTRDLLTVPEREAARRTVREIVRPGMFVPETRLGSHLLRDMQKKSQQMAIVIDEYGSVAGVVTVEDLVEEIVGEIGEEDRAQAPEVVREADGSLLLRGSVSLEKVCELFGVDRAELPDSSGATTVAGLLNTLAGHVPAPGESLDFDGLRFEILEANQRKVLRLRARRKSEPSLRAAHV